jgi:phosphate transport system substrate-binding protein
MNSSGTATSGSNEPVIRRKSSGGRTAIIAAIAVIIVVILVVVVGYQAGWFGGKSSSTTTGCSIPSGTTILGAGSTLVYPLMYQWETVFAGGSVVNYASLGSSTGINDITQKTVDFGASDAPLNPAQRTAAPGLVTIPESAGGVVPIYNLPGVPTLNFNGSILAQIYTGAITNWNNTALQALNVGVTLPSATILPVHRSDGSGTSFIFTSFLSLESAAWKSTYGKSTTFPTNISVGTGQKGNAGVAGYVQKNADTIGYVDLNYALNGGIQTGKVQNPSGKFILASVNNTASALKDANPTLPAATGDWYNVSVLNAPGAGDYPITSFTYVFVYQALNAGHSSSLASATALVDFLLWAVSATGGQSWSAQLYYVPLPASIISADDTTINSLTYNGASVSGCIPT